MRTGKVFWGLLFLAAAVFLLLGTFLPFQVGFFRFVLGVALAAIFIRGIVRVNFPEILLPLAGIAILFRHELSMFFFGGYGGIFFRPWTLIWVAILGSIGLSLLFRRNYFQRFQNPGGDDNRAHWEKNERVENEEDGSRVHCKSSFGSVIKYVNSNKFEYAILQNNFGNMKIYFDNAIIEGGNATVELACAFGNIELYLPKEWTIVNQSDVMFGGVYEKNRNQSAGSPTLTLIGNVTFSSVNIIYV